MPITPTGPISSQLAGVETLLADCPTFRAWVEAASVAEAKDSVYVVGLEAPDGQSAFAADQLVEMRPFVVLDFDKSGDGFAFPVIALGQTSARGRILISFEANIPPEDKSNFKEASYAFLNDVGGILKEMIEKQDTGAYPVIRGANVRLGPRRATTQEVTTKGDHFVVILSLDVGLKSPQ